MELFVKEDVIGIMGACEWASEDEMAAECHVPSQSGRVLWGDVHREYILKDSGEVGHQVGNLQRVQGKILFATLLY